MDDSKYTALHLEPGEHVILEVRRHWIIFAGNIIGFAILALFPVIGIRVLMHFVPTTVVLIGRYIAPLVFVYCLWFLFLWINFFITWTKYFLDVWYVTGSRIIDIQQKRIFYRTISNLRFDRIQDITVDIPGFLATMLHYGDIRVQTASEDNMDFFLATVREPNRVKEIIFNQHNDQKNQLTA